MTYEIKTSYHSSDKTFYLELIRYTESFYDPEEVVKSSICKTLADYEKEHQQYLETIIQLERKESNDNHT